MSRLRAALSDNRDIIVPLIGWAFILALIAL